MLRRSVIAVAAVASVGLVAACSSSGKSGSNNSGGNSGTSGQTTSGGTNSTSASANKKPLNLFWINGQGSTNGQSYPTETTGAKAAVQYINKKLGGVDGHPINMTTCYSIQTPSSTTTCANKAVSEKPAAVMLGTIADDNDVIAVTGKVGIPIIATSGYTAQTLTSKGAAFVVASGGNSSVLANALVMKQEGVKKVGIIYVNVPGVTGGILPLAKQGLDKQGISYDLFPVAYPSPDLTPTLSAINGKKDDAILMIADPITCGAAFSAARALGFDKPFYNPVECGSDANNKLVDALKQTVHIQQISVSLSDTSDPDVTLFRTALKDAGQNPDTPDHYLMNGFQTVMNIYAAAKKAADGGQDPTQTASLVAAVKAGGLHQFLMGKNATFTCDGSALPALPALCSLNTLIGTWKGSSVTDVQPINGADALK